MPNRVGLIGYNSIEFVSLLLYIWNNGDCAVIIDPNMPPDTMHNLLEEANVKKCYIQKGINTLVNDINYTIIEYEAPKKLTVILPNSVYDSFYPNYSREEAVILYSSGTTGNSKGIILSHYAININADAIIDYMCPKEHDSIYIICPE